jgi:N-acetylated-alpha-linked acidic dipeptidase
MSNEIRQQRVAELLFEELSIMLASELNDPRVSLAEVTHVDISKDLRALNTLLLQTERKLGATDGLPRREWFKHQVYAPGFYTGYGVKTMPQIREGLEENRPDEARDGVRKVAAAINGLAEQVEEAAEMLKKAMK